MGRARWSYRSKQTVEKVTPQTTRKSMYTGRLLTERTVPLYVRIGTSESALSSGVNDRISNKTLNSKVALSHSHNSLKKHMSLCVAMTIMVVWSQYAQSRHRPNLIYSSLCRGLFSDYFAIASHWLCYCIVLWCTKRVEYKEVISSSVETSVSLTNVRSVLLTSKLSSKLTSFIDVANMIFSIFFSKFDFFQLVHII